MAFNKDYEKLTYDIDPSINEVVDKDDNNNSIVLRKAKWGNGNYKIEVRRCYIDSSSGKEKVGKGCVFITDNGPNNLTNALIKHGFGDTKDIVSSIKEREDFNISMRMALTDDELDDIKNTNINIPEENLYDPRDILLSEDEYTVEGDD